MMTMMMMINSSISTILRHFIRPYSTALRMCHRLNDIIYKQHFHEWISVFRHLVGSKLRMLFIKILGLEFVFRFCCCCCCFFFFLFFFHGDVILKPPNDSHTSPQRIQQHHALSINDELDCLLAGNSVVVLTRHQRLINWLIGMRIVCTIVKLHNYISCVLGCACWDGEGKRDREREREKEKEKKTAFLLGPCTDVLSVIYAYSLKYYYKCIQIDIIDLNRQTDGNATPLPYRPMAVSSPAPAYLLIMFFFFSNSSAYQPNDG